MNLLYFLVLCSLFASKFVYCCVLFSLPTSPLLTVSGWFCILLVGGPWDDSMAYNHAEWVYDTRFTATPEATEKLKWFGVVVAFLSTFNKQATIVFALLTGQHIFTSIVLFISKFSNALFEFNNLLDVRSLFGSLLYCIWSNFVCYRCLFLQCCPSLFKFRFFIKQTHKLYYSIL